MAKYKVELSGLQKQYNAIIEKYVKKFCNKQGFDFDHLGLNDSVGIMFFDDYYAFSLDDIRLDIDSKQPKGLIIQYYNDSVEYYPKIINYKSYCMGLRFKNLSDLRPLQKC
ncbi:MAG: hypothetical protein HC892_10020 [Saprospiraceae bacterium]|nr:hypothetical protein [Saprospiraceae bacterium]